MQIIKLCLMKEMGRQKMPQKIFLKSIIKSIILSLVCLGVQITFKTRTYRSTSEQSRDCVLHLSNVGDKGSKSG